MHGWVCGLLRFRNYGENMFWGTSGYTLTDAVNLWLSEKSYWDCINNVYVSTCFFLFFCWKNVFFMNLKQISFQQMNKQTNKQTNKSVNEKCENSHFLNFSCLVVVSQDLLALGPIVLITRTEYR
jgi:hypothetical protein